MRRVIRPAPQNVPNKQRRTETGVFDEMVRAIYIRRFPEPKQTSPLGREEIAGGSIHASEDTRVTDE